MKKILQLALIVVGCLSNAIAFAEPIASANESWKGTPSNSEFTGGGMVGMGLIGNVAGFAIVGNLGKKIVHQGFVPEINNQVYAEAQLGTVMRTGGDAFIYSAHLRWDFVYDPRFTLFALGGFAGHSVGGAGGDLPIAPRVGIGVFWTLNPIFTLRGEVSHELISVGASFAI